MKNIRILALSILLGGASIAINAQNRHSDFQNVSSIDTVVDVFGEKYIFIRHDSIPLVLADSVTDFNGKKKATKDLYESTLYNYALTPLLPLSPRHTSFNEATAMKKKETDFFEVTDGMFPAGINYHTKICDEEVIIDSHEKFREIFAPVQTAQEAIAFAYYMTKSEPLYNLDYLVDLAPKVETDTMPSFKIQPVTGDTIWNIKIIPLKKIRPAEEEWMIYTPEIISSYAVKVEDGYELLLYHYKVFGCEHPYSRRHIKVFFNRVVKIIDEQEAFQCFGAMGYCVD